MQIITNKKWDALHEQIKAMQRTTVSEMINNFSTKIFPNWSIVKEMDAYQTMDFVYCVVKKLATCSALIPFYGYDKKGEDLGENDNLVTFLNTLDYEEKEKLYTYLYLYGEVFALKNRTELGPNSAKVNKLTFLNPGRVSISISDTFPREIVQYNYFDAETGTSIPIDIDDMFTVRLFNPSCNTVEEFRGLSPVKVLARTLTRVQAGEDATVAQLQNGGTPGIVFDKVIGLDTTVTGQRKESFSRFLKNSANKGAPYFAGNELGYIALGTPLTDLEVMELAGMDFDRVCNAFGVSSVLFNNKSASTESNVKEMLGEMYENTIIPNVYRVEGALNKSVVPDIKTLGTIKCDTSEIKALQEDEAALVNALAAAWWLKPNEKRERMEYDQDKDPMMDMFLVPSNLVPLEDLQVPDELDNSAGDYVAPADANKNPKVVPLKTGTNG
jgi:HK97 family phage portal protein